MYPNITLLYAYKLRNYAVPPVAHVAEFYFPTFDNLATKGKQFFLVDSFG